MAYLLGTDEAGYGPNLGPLVVSATLWRIADEQVEADLYDVLGDVVMREARADDPRLAIADSKQLYHPGGGLAALEHGVLTALRLCDATSRTGECDLAVRTAGRSRHWKGIWPCMDPQLGDELDSIAWFRDYDADLPCDAELEAIEQYSAALAVGLGQAGVELLAVRSRVLCEGRFNQLLEQRDNKADVLSRTTLDLVAELLEPLHAGPIHIHCDKHGGRNHYVPLLQQTFPEHLIEVRREGRAESIYRWGPPERRIEIRFVAGGEAALPAALASMASKYLRELAMKAFNAFWLREVPGIRPTAGYSVDAKRFRREIAAKQARLAIEDRHLWRNK